MENPLTLDTLLQSCTVLFGSNIDISRDFLDYLQISGIKNAYRKRAKETHPDLTVRMTGDVREERSDSFLCVRESYENLKKYIQNRDDSLLRRPVSAAPAEPFRQGRSAAGARTFRAAAGFTGDNAADTEEYEFWWDDADFPARKLMLGDFLYFARVAEWQDIIRALVWQKAGRPRLGDLGCRFGWLQQRDIQKIFHSQRPGKRFGEIAVQLGFLDSQQRDRLVFYQKCRQQKIGQYFVAKGFLTAQELLMYLRMLNRHNAFHAAGV